MNWPFAQQSLLVALLLEAIIFFKAVQVVGKVR